MKFARELERDLVPEWRLKYLNYKAGKKHVKAVARAAKGLTAQNIHSQTPPSNHSIYGSTLPFQPRPRAVSSLRRSTTFDDDLPAPLQPASAPGPDPRLDSDDSSDGPSKLILQETPPMVIPEKKKSPTLSESAGAYGSFVPTPQAQKHHPFELPEPAIGSENAPIISSRPSTPKKKSLPLRSASLAVAPSAYEVGPTTSPKSTFATFRDRIPRNGARGSARRMLSSAGTPLNIVQSRRSGRSDTDMVAFDQVRAKQKDFFKWMDKELDKIETFYKSKEDETGARLEILREQLHEMRNRRIEEIAMAQHAKAIRKEDDRVIYNDLHLGNGKQKNSEPERPSSGDHFNAWLDPLQRAVGGAKAKAFNARHSSNSEALHHMKNSPAIQSQSQVDRNNIDKRRDYIRRPHHPDEVRYRTAKRKLKLAMQEFYRGMELLKSYALLNRTAFRKINKKYDKAFDAHPPLRYMSEKVNKSWFVQSDVLDGHLHAAEDMYARYFERGNHKIATGKLRSSSAKGRDQSGSAFQNGLLIGLGTVFSVQGVIYGRNLLENEDPTIRTQTEYLLQIYAGYFLALYLFSWFCLDCSVWARQKINYSFVFEFDPRHDLDWRQLSEFPSFLLLVFGLFIWLNFSRYGSPEMFIYYPVILIFVTAVIIFFPGPFLFHRSRRWFVYSHWRLLLAGLYPVEFRDFFLGDMYCSLTYFTSNIELFFCLYAVGWDNPAQCNSTHSRLLGFFCTIPGIWRALQCLRRYYDTRNIFPHLVNCGKYAMTISYYVTLSIYRINNTKLNLAVFITFATINSIYCSVWDLLMDWSLLQSNASKPLLRDVRGYKSIWYYYGAMILDPILRFNWIAYAIYTHDTQHGTIASFLIAFSEVTRRGIWTLFRVENEHCSNVARFKASRDVPLPYSLHDEDFLHEETSIPAPDDLEASPPTSDRRDTSSALDAQYTNRTPSLRRRPMPMRSLTKIVADAHTQDFEKKRKPGAGDSDSPANRAMDEAAEHDSSDDDNENDAQDILDAEALIRERSGVRDEV